MPDVTVGSTAAYLAIPSSSAAPWPGVVVIHEAFGLNADIRGHADRLAALGYLALVPDLLGGKFWMRCVRSMIGQLRAGSGPAFGVLDACRSWLAEAGHSFMSPKPARLAPLTALARLQYDKAAAEDAWQRIFAFFGTYLK